MKLILVIMMGLYSLSSFATCKVYVPFKEFNYAGLVIRFDFYSMFADKGYTETNTQEDANYELILSDEEVEGRFHQAKIQYKLIDLTNDQTLVRTKKEKTCFTQNCGISDFQNIWNKGYKDFGKKLPKCNN